MLVASMRKVTVYMSDDLLLALDSAAGEVALSRSAFIREVVRDRLVRTAPARRDGAVRLLHRGLRDGVWDATALVRAERDR